MSLETGARLGPYEVLAPIGKGGPAFAERGVPPPLWRVLRSHERTAR